MTKTLSVSAIKNGTVIDHVKSGNSLRILHFLGLFNKDNQITLGINLPSKRLGRKDLIKIEGVELNVEQANGIMVFAPDVTINIVNNFEVKQKLEITLPESITNVFLCPNLMCISQDKNVASIFYIEERGRFVDLCCHYCERKYDRDQVKVKI